MRPDGCGSSSFPIGRDVHQRGRAFQFLVHGDDLAGDGHIQLIDRFEGFDRAEVAPGIEPHTHGGKVHKGDFAELILCEIVMPMTSVSPSLRAHTWRAV